MENNEKEVILKKFYDFCKDNFDYDPITLQKPRSIFSKSLIFKPQKTKLRDINFPDKEEISSKLIYHILFILNQSDEAFIKINKDIIHKILSFIYEFIDKKEDFDPIFSFNSYFDEIVFPFFNSSNIKSIFKEKIEFNLFLLFNVVLILSKGITEEIYENLYFSILDILVLYNYFFINDYEEDIGIKNIIIEIITTIINGYKLISNNNIIINFLIGFFFDEGEINKNNFLVPENTNINNTGYEDFFKNILEKINNEMKSPLLLNNDFFENLTQIKRIKFSHININEKKEENEIEVIDLKNKKEEDKRNQNEEIRKLNEIILQLKENINSKEKEIKIQKEEINNLKNDLVCEQMERIVEINAFRKEILEKNDKLEYQDKLIIEQNQKINEQEVKINDQNKIIKSQQIKLNEQKMKLDLQELLLSNEKINMDKSGYSEDKTDNNTSKNLSHFETEI